MKITSEKNYLFAINSYFGHGYKLLKKNLLTGGSINQVYWLQFSNGESLVVKENKSSRKNLFFKEAFGLNFLKKTIARNKENSLITPKPYLAFESSHYRYLVMEYIKPLKKATLKWHELGKGLALLHKEKILTSKKYGLDYKNYLGETNQKNGFHDNWVSFFKENQLLFQMDKARKNNYLSIQLEKNLYRVLANLEDILEEHPFPSLLHGDLWTGNVMFDEQGNPVIIDPTIYFGERESDVALTELFGRLDDEFYESYFEINPPSKNYQQKKLVYNLYHLLNHLNLFGLGYLSSVQKSVARLL